MNREARRAARIARRSSHQILRVCVLARATFAGALFRFAAALTIAAIPCAALAEYPDHAVRLVVPFAPGGATDVTARLLAEQLSKRWGQSVVVENRVGAAGGVGAAEVAHAHPDGYTLLFPSGSVLTANQHIYRKLAYDPVKDFRPITNVASGPQVLVVPAGSLYRTTADLIAAARGAPGKINFGSGGVGSQIQLAAESFLHTARIDAVHIPYQGEGQALAGLLAGDTTFVIANLAAAIGHIRSGRLRALAVTSRTRAAQLPDVPTLAETLPGFENYGWFGIAAPAGTPKDVVDRVHRDVVHALAATELRARLYVLGLTPVGNSPAEFAKAIRAESERWAKVIQERHIAVD